MTKEATGSGRSESFTQAAPGTAAASSSGAASAPQPKRSRVDPMPMLDDVVHEQLNELPDGVTVIHVGGISGVSGFCRSASLMFQASDVAVARSNANRFLGTAAADCDLCN